MRAFYTDNGTKIAEPYAAVEERVTKMARSPI